MGTEREPGIRITGIALDLEGRSLLLAHHDQVLATITLAAEGLIFQAPDAATASLVDIIAPQEPAAPSLPKTVPAPTREVEKHPTVTLEGKLKSKPTPGRPDRRGKPTACARFAAHVEGEDKAHMYFATFHRHTAELALALDADAPVTVEGYPHPSDSPEDRLDTLSVVHLVEYPGRSKRS